MLNTLQKKGLVPLLRIISNHNTYFIVAGERTSPSPAYRFVFLRYFIAAEVLRRLAITRLPLGHGAHQREAVDHRQTDDDPQDQGADQPGPLGPELHLDAGAVEVGHLDLNLGLAAGLRLRECRLGNLELGADPRQLGQVARCHKGLVAPQHGQEHDDDAAEGRRQVDERRAAHERQADQGQGDDDAEHAVALEQGLAGAVLARITDVGHQLAPEPEPERGHVHEHAQEDDVQDTDVDRPERLCEAGHGVAERVHQVEDLLERPLRRHQHDQK